jgi:outer membrane protein assembly factor BamB
MEQRKKQPLLSPGNIAPCIARNKVFIVAPDRYFTALDLKTGTTIWRTNRHLVRESMGMNPSGKSIYAKLMNDSIISVSSASGEFKTHWAVDAGTGYDHNPCPLVSDGKIVIGATKNGLLVAVDDKTQNVRWKYKVGNSSVNKLVIRNKQVWLTSTEGKIVSLTHVL